MSLGNKSSDFWEKIELDDSLVSNALKLAERDLKTAENVFEDNDFDWSFAISYNAMLQAGRALMFSKGFRPKGEAKHVAVFEFVKEFFGSEFAEKLLFMFNKIRKKRHTIIYEQVNLVSEAEAKTALSVAKDFFERVKQLLKGL